MMTGDYQVPAQLDLFLRGLGLFVLPLSDKLCYLNIPEGGKGKDGWGTVSAETQCTWECWPNPGTYENCILNDMRLTEGEGLAIWNLPVSMRCAELGARHPTANLLGWVSAKKLILGQLFTLKTAGINSISNTDTSCPWYAVNLKLLRAISQ